MNKEKLIKELISWGIVIAVALTLAFLINRLVLFKVVTPTGSMENTIKAGNKAEVFRLAYKLGDPKRGDIVVFPFPDDESEDRLKRIIGLPGEKIEGRDGKVYIDDKPIEEAYIKEAWDEDFGPLQIPEEHYFMMGDNRVESLDARHWNKQFVHRKKLKGKVIFKYPDFKWLYKAVDYID